MAAARELESQFRLGDRPRGWWRKPLGWTWLTIYSGQLIPLVVGPLNECAHCVGNYLKVFVLIPGLVMSHGMGEWLGAWMKNSTSWGGSYLDRVLILAAVILIAVIFAATMITAKLQGRRRWLWLGFLALLSAANGLVVSAALRL